MHGDQYHAYSRAVGGSFPASDAPLISVISSCAVGVVPSAYDRVNTHARRPAKPGRTSTFVVTLPEGVTTRTRSRIVKVSDSLQVSRSGSDSAGLETSKNFYGFGLNLCSPNLACRQPAAAESSATYGFLQNPRYIVLEGAIVSLHYHRALRNDGCCHGGSINKAWIQIRQMAEVRSRFDLHHLNLIDDTFV